MPSEGSMESVPGPSGGSWWPRKRRADLDSRTSGVQKAGAGHLESILDALTLVGLGSSAGVEASAGSESVYFPYGLPQSLNHV